MSNKLTDTFNTLVTMLQNTITSTNFEDVVKELKVIPCIDIIRENREHGYIDFNYRHEDSIADLFICTIRVENDTVSLFNGVEYGLKGSDAVAWHFARESGYVPIK